MCGRTSAAATSGVCFHNGYGNILQSRSVTSQTLHSARTRPTTFQLADQRKTCSHCGRFQASCQVLAHGKYSATSEHFPPNSRRGAVRWASGCAPLAHSGRFVCVIRTRALRREAVGGFCICAHVLISGRRKHLRSKQPQPQVPRPKLISQRASREASGF